MEEALVEYDYDAVNPDELTIKVGSTISNIKIMDGGWWEGEVNGKRGMFPDNFVKIIKKEDSIKNTASTPVVVNGQSSADEVIKRDSSSQKKKKRAKVTYSYAPQNEDELLLEVDTEIEVTNQPEPGWWEGVVKGKKGMFPSNFVELLPDEEENDEAKLVKPKAMPKGPGFGDIFKDSKVKLKPVVVPAKQESANKADAPKSVRPLAGKRDSLKGSAAQDPSKHNKVDTSTVEKALVEYDYDPKNPDELQLKKGTTINIISRDIGDKGWWKGEYDGKLGVFPDNFVKLLPPEEPKAKMPPGRPGTGPKDTKRTSVRTEKTPMNDRKVPLPGAKPVLPAAPKTKPRPAPEPKPKPSPSQEESVKDMFDDVKAPISKLNHPTKDRAKPDHKRPPSSHLQVTENQRRLMAKRPSLPVILDHVEYESHDGPVKSPVTNKSFSPAMGGTGGAASNQGTNELKIEMKVLRTELANMKKDMKKEIENLVQELDEEKKLRMNMQVELDRVKRMLKH